VNGLASHVAAQIRQIATPRHRLPPALRRARGPGRTELLERLARVGDDARRHPGFVSANKLLNQVFRRASLGQRAAVLQSANWLIEVLEQLALIV
jgi:hypothetical protein